MTYSIMLKLPLKKTVKNKAGYRRVDVFNGNNAANDTGVKQRQMWPTGSQFKFYKS